MSYDLFVKRRLDEIEEKLLTKEDPIERLFIWFMFIKDFSAETHSLLDQQYTELVTLCKAYVDTPDLVARQEIRQQIKACSQEIANFSAQLKRIPPLQNNLEKEVLGFDYGDEEED